MKLDITPILKNPGAALNFVFDAPLDMLEGGIGTVSFTGPVHLEGRIRNINGMLELEAEARVPYQTQCDRCCDPISDTLSVPIREDVVEQSESAPEAPEAEKEERYTFTGHTLVLDVIAAEALLLQAPAYNLCKQDCQGLCSECGTNRNRNACDCGSHRPMDFRLEALKRFSDPDET